MAKAEEPKKPTATPATPAKTSPPSVTEQATATKKNHKVIIILAIVAAVVFLVLPIIAFTVGGVILGKKINESGVKVNTDDKSVTIKDNDGNEFSAGGGQSLPSDFPTGIPIYQGDISASGKVNSDGKTGWTVAVATNDSPATVATALANSFTTDGWTTDMNNATADGGLVIAKKGNLRVNIYYTAKDGKTTILYTVVDNVSE